MLERLARDTVAAWPGSSVSFKVQESYRNLNKVLERHPEVIVNLARVVEEKA